VVRPVPRLVGTGLSLVARPVVRGRHPQLPLRTVAQGIRHYRLRWRRAIGPLGRSPSHQGPGARDLGQAGKRNLVPKRTADKKRPAPTRGRPNL
jgi:hypothetical protein